MQKKSVIDLYGVDLQDSFPNEVLSNIKNSTDVFLFASISLNLIYAKKSTLKYMHWGNLFDNNGPGRTKDIGITLKLCSMKYFDLCS